MSHNVFNVFTYEKLDTSPDGTKIFIDCKFLKPFGKYIKGDKVSSLAIQLELFIYDEDGSMIENDSIIIK